MCTFEMNHNIHTRKFLAQNFFALNETTVFNYLHSHDSYRENFQGLISPDADHSLLVSHDQLGSQHYI